MKVFKLAVAGMVLAIALVFFGSVIWIGPVRAETKGEWYRSLRHPVTKQGCCSEADCARTPARFDRASGLWLVPPEGRIVDGNWTDPPPGPWVPVPKDTILTDKNSQDGVSAYVCWVGGKVFCFVQGEAGG